MNESLVKWLLSLKKVGVALSLGAVASAALAEPLLLTYEATSHDVSAVIDTVDRGLNWSANLAPLHTDGRQSRIEAVADVVKLAVVTFGAAAADDQFARVALSHAVHQVAQCLVIEGGVHDCLVEVTLYSMRKYQLHC